MSERKTKKISKIITKNKYGKYSKRGARIISEGVAESEFNKKRLLQKGKPLTYSSCPLLPAASQSSNHVVKHRRNKQ